MANQLDSEDLHRTVHEEPPAPAAGQEQRNRRARVPVRGPASEDAAQPGEVLGGEAVQKRFRLREHYARITAEAARISGVPTGRILSRARDDLASTVRHTLIKAIADRSSGYELKLLQNFFLRDRTSIIYSAGRRSRKPAWDWDLHRELTAFIDNLSAAEDVAKKRKLKVTAALREAMELSRIAASVSPGDGDVMLRALLKEREREMSKEVARMADASKRVALASGETEPLKGEKVVRRFFEIMQYQQASLGWLQHRSGVSAETIRKWKAGKTPGFSNFIACLNALGYDLAIKEQET